MLATVFMIHLLLYARCRPKQIISQSKQSNVLTCLNKDSCTMNALSASRRIKIEQFPRYCCVLITSLRHKNTGNCMIPSDCNYSLLRQSLHSSANRTLEPNLYVVANLNQAEQSARVQDLFRSSYLHLRCKMISACLSRTKLRHDSLLRQLSC